MARPDRSVSFLAFRSTVKCGVSSGLSVEAFSQVQDVAFCSSFTECILSWKSVVSYKTAFLVFIEMIVFFPPFVLIWCFT